MRFDNLELRAFFDSFTKKMINSSKYRITAISIFLSISIYIVGIISQFFQYGFSKHYDSIGNVKGYVLSINPITVYFRAFTSMRFWYLYIVVIIVLIIAVSLFLRADTGERRDDRGILISDRGTYGTANIAGIEEIAKDFYVGHISKSTEPILGYINADPSYNPLYDDRVKPLDFDTYTNEEVDLFWKANGQKKYVVTYPLLENRKHHNKFNYHKLIIGGSGTGKSFTKINTDILQIISAEESYVAVDPKGAVYSDTVNAARKAGYTVKVFNINVEELTTSDSWAPLHEIDPNGANLESLAQQFSQVIVSNTSESSGDDFYSLNDKNLLTALTLYVVTNGTEGTVGEIYSLLSMDTESLTEIFKSLPEKHPAKAAWNIFAKGSDNVVGNTMNSLGGRLQVFQSKLIRDITSTPDIDLALPGREKCAYYVVLSDSDTSMRFLSSLFFAFLFTKLNAEAKEQSFITGKEQLKVPVNILLDEFPNIGKIPDFPEKLATVRSRGIAITIVIQALGQLQHMYEKVWEPLVANCDELTFLGATDLGTAKYISEKSGTMTIKTESGGVNESLFGSIVAPKAKSRGEGQRAVFNPQEVTTKPRGLSYVFMSARNVMVLEGMPYKDHPLAKDLVDDSIAERIPFYRTRKSFYEKYKITEAEQIVFKSRLGLDIPDEYVDVRKSQRMALTTEDRARHAIDDKIYSQRMYEDDLVFQELKRQEKEKTGDSNSIRRDTVFTVGSKTNEEIRLEAEADYKAELEEGLHDNDMSKDVVPKENQGLFDFIYEESSGEEEIDPVEEIEEVEDQGIDLDDLVSDEEESIESMFAGEDEIIDEFDMSDFEDEENSIMDLFKQLEEDDDDEDDVPLYEIFK